MTAAGVVGWLLHQPAREAISLGRQAQERTAACTGVDASVQYVGSKAVSLSARSGARSASNAHQISCSYQQVDNQQALPVYRPKLPGLGDDCQRQTSRIPMPTEVQHLAAGSASLGIG